MNQMPHYLNHIIENHEMIHEKSPYHSKKHICNKDYSD